MALLLLTPSELVAQDPPPLSIQQAALSRISNVGTVPLARNGLPQTTAFNDMYVALALMQAIDVHSTIVATRAGAREANPVLTGVAGNPAALIAVKAASAAGTAYFIETLRRKNGVAAAAMMATIVSGYALVVMHNARVASRVSAR